MSDYEVTLGDLDLLGDTFSVLADGFSPGAPEVVVSALARQLMDGEIVTHVRDSNRELSFRVEVSGDDVLALNEAEALLVAEVHRPRNTLRLKKAGPSTPVSVFDTFRGSLREVPNDVAELPRGSGLVRRVYEVTLPADPHARSSVLRSSVLVTPPSSPTLLDAADSTVNWVPGADNGWPTPTLDTSVKREGTGSLKITGTYRTYGNGSGGGTAMGWARTATFAAAAGTHVQVSLKGNYPIENATLHFTASDAPTGYVSPVSTEAVADGWTVYTFRLPSAMTVTSLEVRAAFPVHNLYEVATYTHVGWLDEVRTYVGAVSATKQGVWQLDTGGSVRTPGSLRLSNATTDLGSVLVYTFEDKGDAYRPDLARWSVGGPVYDVPNRTLHPGPYAVWVRYGRASPGNRVTVSAVTRLGGVDVGESVAVSAAAPDVVDLLVPVGVLHLPARGSAPQGTAMSRITVSGVTTVSEAFLFRLDGQLTVVDNAKRRLWIESPTPDQPYGGVWTGSTVNDEGVLTDGIHPGADLRMLGRHVFEAPVASVFVSAFGAVPDIALQHYPRWHTNAGA